MRACVNVFVPAHARLPARVRLWKHPEEEEAWGSQWGQEESSTSGYRKCGGRVVAGWGWKDGGPCWRMDDCSRGRSFLQKA